MERYTFIVVFNGNFNLIQDMAPELTIADVHFVKLPSVPKVFKYEALSSDYIVTANFVCNDVECSGGFETSLLSGPGVLPVLESLALAYLPRCEGMDLGGGDVVSAEITKSTRDAPQKIRATIHKAFASFKEKVTKQTVRCRPWDTENELRKLGIMY